MSATETNEMSDVLKRVRVWAPEMQIVFARKILETIDSPEISEPPRKMSLNQVFGLLKTNSPPPDDEECAKIVEEERLRKHG